MPQLPEEFILPVASASGTCNAYLPNGPTTLPRYLWVVQYLVASGMYVMVSEWEGDGAMMSAHAFWCGGEWVG